MNGLVGHENHHWNGNDMENGTTGNNRKSQLDPRGTRTPDPTITGRVLLPLSYRVTFLPFTENFRLFTNGNSGGFELRHNYVTQGLLNYFHNYLRCLRPGLALVAWISDWFGTGDRDEGSGDSLSASGLKPLHNLLHKRALNFLQFVA